HLRELAHGGLPVRFLRRLGPRHLPEHRPGELDAPGRPGRWPGDYVPRQLTGRSAMHRKRSLPQAPLALALPAPPGSPRPAPPHPGKGAVVFEDGQPAKELAGYAVSFTPAAPGGLPSSYGHIEQDATFVLSCKKDSDGAVAGKHRVVISPPDPFEGGGGDERVHPPPMKAVMDPATAEQEVMVEPKSNKITLKVKRAAGRGRKAPN